MKSICIFFIFLICIIHRPGSVCADVYDCFIFFNELDILEIRFNELYDHVDKFVLVESPHTFKGEDKSLFFAKNKERFSRFLDKLIYICVDLPSFDFKKTQHFNYQRENFQRNEIMQGLVHCNDQDIIFISDVDEIWRGTNTNIVSQKLLSNEYNKVALTSVLYRYFLDRQDNYTPYWNGTGAITYGHLKTMTPSLFRGLITGWWADWKKHSRPYYLSHHSNLGWHFTFVGGHEKVKAKIRAFSHIENDHPHFSTDPKVIDANVQEWTHQVNIDQSYPKYIQDNAEHFREIGFLYN